MTNCFKCGKILPGNLRPGEYVMCKECEDKWRRTEEAVNKDIVEVMRKNVMDLKPFGWVFLPKAKDALTIKVDRKEIVLCRDCKHRPKRLEGSAVGGFALIFPDAVCPCRCDDDAYYSWEPSEDWFCADGEKVGGDV